MSGGFDIASPIYTSNPDTPFLVALRLKIHAMSRSPEDAAADYLAVGVATTTLFSRVLLRVLDYILTQPGLLQELSSLGPAELEARLIKSIREYVSLADDIGARIGYVSAMAFARVRFLLIILD